LTADEVTLLTRAASAPRRVEAFFQWMGETANEDAESDSGQGENTNSSEEQDAPLSGSLAAEDSLSRSLITLANAYRDAVMAMLREASKHEADNTGVDGS
jgi:hypothetical protein